MDKRNNQKGFIDSEILKAIVVGLELPKNKTAVSMEESLEELKELARAAEIEVVAYVNQKLDKPKVATYLGTGKLEEIKASAKELGAEILLVDDELTGIQIRNLEETLDLEIIDRTSLILDIFATRAKTREGKLQVDLARLKYLKSREGSGIGKTLSRQGGGIGSRGLGEKKLELDRRNISSRIADLEKRLRKLKEQRELQKVKRKRSSLPQVSLIGYTNAGKSTLMNYYMEQNNPKWSRDKSPAKDMLFATLDPFHRRVSLKGMLDFILVDTVGFVSKLPHDLVEAFISTLEEAKDSDLLIYVVDVANEHHAHQLQVTRDVVKGLGIDDIPFIIVENKIDKVAKEALISLSTIENTYKISAKTGEGMEALTDIIQEKLLADYQQVELLIPYKEAKLLHELLENAPVISKANKEAGTLLEIYLRPELIKRYADFLIRVTT